MICHKCNNQGVENEALGKKFWYCRTCKDEITAAPPQPEPNTPKKSDYDRYWYSGQSFAPLFTYKQVIVPGDKVRVRNKQSALFNEGGTVISRSGDYVEVDTTYFGTVTFHEYDLELIPSPSNINQWGQAVAVPDDTLDALKYTLHTPPPPKITGDWVQLDLFYDSLVKKGKSYD